MWPPEFMHSASSKAAVSNTWQRLLAGVAIVALVLPPILRSFADHHIVPTLAFYLALLAVGPVWIVLMMLALHRLGARWWLAWSAAALAAVALIVPPVLFNLGIQQVINGVWVVRGTVAFGMLWLALFALGLLCYRRKAPWLLLSIVPVAFWPTVAFTFTSPHLSHHVFYDTCNHMQFADFSTADKITVTDNFNRAVKSDIVSPDKIKQIAAFAASFESKKWIAPAAGVPVGKYHAKFYSGDRFLGDFGYGDRFLAAQGCRYFYIHMANGRQVQEYATLIGVRPRALLTILSRINDSPRHVTVELGQVVIDDLNSAYVLRLFRNPTETYPVHEAGVPIMLIHAPQPIDPRLEQDGNCYVVRSRFNPVVDKLTSSYFKDAETGHEFCFYVITPELKRIGFREQPRGIGHALGMHVFDRSVLLAVAKGELVNKSIDEAARLLEGYGFARATQGGASSNREIFVWSDAPRGRPRLYSVRIAMTLILADGNVESIDVQPVLSGRSLMGRARARLPDHVLCDACMNGWPSP